jgi:hypothetical protein
MCRLAERTVAVVSRAVATHVRYRTQPLPKAGSSAPPVGGEGVVQTGLAQLGEDERTGPPNRGPDPEAAGGVVAGEECADVGRVDERHVQQIDEKYGGAPAAGIDQDLP